MTEPTDILRDPPDEPAAEATPEADTASASSTAHFHRWWRIADFGVLGLWMAVVGFTLRHHEKWVDEAQAWLFARDLDFRTLWFYELRYEGSPGLWHTILWIAQHVFRAPYAALGPIGMACATAGVALLIFKAPFPRYVRWPLAFTYFMVYQYAVIARQYTLLPLFTFAAAILFADREHPERLTLVLVLLANVSSHGTIMAGCLGLAYLVEAIPSWRSFDARLRARYWVCVGAMVLTFGFVYIVVRPPTDSLELLVKPGLFQQPGWANRQGEVISPALKFNTIISGALLDYPAPSAIFLIFAGAWCFTRRKLLVFALPVTLLIALYSFLYGTAHHHGTVFLAAIAGVWIAWPSKKERQAFNLGERHMLQGMTALLLCLCAVNIWDAAVAIHRDYLYPYSGAEDAANYLKAVDAEHKGLCGYGFGISAVQAYFDHKVLANIPTSYTHNGLPGWGLRLDVDQLRQINPEYVVAFSVDPNEMMKIDAPVWASLGYEFVHFSDGYYFYKRGVYERETYLIFRRVQH